MSDSGMNDEIDRMEEIAVTAGNVTDSNLPSGQADDTAENMASTFNSVSGKARRNVTFFDILAKHMADCMLEVTATKVDPQTFRADVLNVVRTLVALGASDEYSLGIRVGGQLFRFGEYAVMTEFTPYVAPKKVIVLGENEEGYCSDLVNRRAYQMNGGSVLSPDNFLMAEKRINKAYRRPLNTEAYERRMMSLTDALKLSVSDNCVHSMDQGQIIMLKQPEAFVDSYYTVPTIQWLRMWVASRFERA